MQDAINHITREPYSGRNQTILSAWAAANGYTPVFLTFRQAFSIRRCVRKGEHGRHIVKIVESAKVDSNGRRLKGPRGYTVFAVAQTDAFPTEGAM